MKPLAIENSSDVAISEPADVRLKATFTHRLQYWAVLAVVRALGWMPNRVGRSLCAALAALSYWLWPRLRRVGLYNLRLAFPEWTQHQRRKVIYGLFQNFGRMLADFARFPHWNRGNIEDLVI